MKSLEILLLKVDVLDIRGDQETMVSHITSDSRAAGEGSVFVAVRGSIDDGHKYVGAAIKNGAHIIIAEEPLSDKIPPHIIWVQVRNSREVLARITDAFYDYPSRELRLIGVTGTNGKTSVVFTLYQIFNQLGFACGLLSTIKNCWPGHEETARLTTPDVVTLQASLRTMVDAGCDFVFMEVSSHAAHQGRIDGLTFAGGVFTNITHDHLDYHGSFAHYIEAKKSFFDGLSKESFALINMDDRHAQIMVQNCKAKVARFGLKHMAEFKGRILENRLEGLQLRIGQKVVSTRLIGEFNASNLLAAYGTAMLLGMEDERVLMALSACHPIEGRMDVLRDESGRVGIIDFAHTPDALEKVIQTIQKIKSNKSRLIVVVGCGGDRDRAKRPLMGHIASSMADEVIFTSDNPRSEDPEHILQEMISGVLPENLQRVQMITSRAQAIQIAAKWAMKGDVVLIAGKGHETYQEIKGVRTPFDDKSVLKEALERFQIPVEG